jgi:hypothetical protein
MILDLEPDDELEDNPNQSDLVRPYLSPNPAINQRNLVQVNGKNNNPNKIWCQLDEAS